MNKLETELSQNDLNCLFSTKVEKASNNYFYIMTKTHRTFLQRRCLNRKLSRFSSVR